VANFDYSAPADVFPGRTGKRPMGYRRFDTAAQAIRYVIEEMPKEFLDSTVLEVDDERLKGEQIQLLYTSKDYPLARK
jgi:hypothetical protein